MPGMTAMRSLPEAMETSANRSYFFLRDRDRVETRWFSNRRFHL